MLVSSFPSKGWYVGWPGVAFRGPCVYCSALDVKTFRYVSCYWAVFIAHLLLMGLKWKCTIWCSIVILNPTFLNLIFSQRQPHYYTIPRYYSKECRARWKFCTVILLLWPDIKVFVSLLNSGLVKVTWLQNDPVTKVQW